MTPWDRERFDSLEQRVIATTGGMRPTIDVPYYIYLYDPVEELMALEEFRNLEMRLRTRGHSVETIWMPDLMLAALERFKLLGPELERESREWLKRDLERILPEDIASQLKSRLRGKGVDYCAVILRCGALFPFVHVSTLLNLLEGFVNCTLVVAYPGNREGYILNERGETIKSYYRAEII